MIDFLFLGTSSGVPTAYRNVSGLAIRMHHSKEWMLIDAGEGTQHTIAKAKLSLLQLKAIAITHSHGDHCFGVPGILASASMAQRKTALSIICTAEVWQWLQQTIALTEMYLSYELEWIDVKQSGNLLDYYHHAEATNPTLNDVSRQTSAKALRKKPFSLGNSEMSVCSQALVHRVASYAFVFELHKSYLQLIKLEELEQLSIPKYFWHQLQQGQNVTWNGKTLLATDYTKQQNSSLKWIVGGDNAEPAVLAQACKNTTLLIHEATYSQAILEKVGPGPMHSSAKLLAQFAEQAKLPHLVLTHLSARYHHAKGEAEILNEAKSFYSGNCCLARDGAIFTLFENGQFQLSSSFLASA
jgi:ribonuclease Z